MDNFFEKLGVKENQAPNSKLQMLTLTITDSLDDLFAVFERYPWIAVVFTFIILVAFQSFLINKIEDYIDEGSDELSYKFKNLVRAFAYGGVAVGTVAVADYYYDLIDISAIDDRLASIGLDEIKTREIIETLIRLPPVSIIVYILSLFVNETKRPKGYKQFLLSLLIAILAALNTNTEGSFAFAVEKSDGETLIEVGNDKGTGNSPKRTEGPGGDRPDESDLKAFDYLLRNPEEETQQQGVQINKELSMEALSELSWSAEQRIKSRVRDYVLSRKEQGSSEFTESDILYRITTIPTRDRNEPQTYNVEILDEDGSVMATVIVRDDDQFPDSFEITDIDISSLPKEVQANIAEYMEGINERFELTDKNRTGINFPSRTGYGLIGGIFIILLFMASVTKEKK